MRVAGRTPERMPDGYAQWLVEVKARVQAAQVRAVRAVNCEVIMLYWSIGRDIVDRQRTLGWGAKVIDRVAVDLSREFPGQRGWSPTNLKYMRMFAEGWPDLGAIGPQVVDQLPWGHVRALIDGLKTRDDRDWYAQQAVTEGWSRAVLELQIRSGLRGRLGAAASNFAAALPPADSDLAQQLTKDPYVFDHVTVSARCAERSVEQALMDRLQDTLLELGRGMTFVGRQVRFTVDGVDRHVDLLMFHVEQLRYVVVELKVGPFEPGHLGQLGMYVAMVDDRLRRPDLHAPTVGLLLCTGTREATVRYSLASTAAPVAVAQWQGLPPDAQATLPSAEELQAVVDDELAHQRAGVAAQEKSS